MPAIAKFVSYDGGVAFSDKVVKFQKRGSEGLIIPIGEVASVNVRKPQPDADGFIRVLTTDGKRYRLSFEQSQYAEAVRFKRQFVSTCAPAEPEAAPEAAPAEMPRHASRQAVQEEPVPEEEPVREPARRSSRKRAEEQWEEPSYDDYYGEEEAAPDHSTLTRVLLILVIITAVAAIALAVYIFAIRGDSLSLDSGAPAPGRAETAETVSAPAPDLTGSWRQVGGNSADTYHVATISSDTIEVYWHMGADNTNALYWAGSFQAPTTAAEPFSWTSANDTAKTGASLMASSDASKVFTYEAGEISYEASAMGVTQTVHLARQ